MRSGLGRASSETRAWLATRNTLVCPNSELVMRRTFFMVGWEKGELDSPTRKH